MSFELPSLFDLLSAYSPDSIAFVSGEHQGTYSELAEGILTNRADFSHVSGVLPPTVFFEAETSLEKIFLLNKIL